MIGLDQDLLEVEVVEVTEKIVMMMGGMIEMIGGGIMIMMKNDITTLLWYCFKFHILYYFMYSIIDELIFSLCLLQAPSATIIVKGLSQKTNEEDLYQNLV